MFEWLKDNEWISSWASIVAIIVVLVSAAAYISSLEATGTANAIKAEQNEVKINETREDIDDLEYQINSVNAKLERIDERTIYIKGAIDEIKSK